MTVVVRPARAEDRAFVLDTCGRMAAFGPPEWRTPEEVVEGEARTLRAWFDAPPPGTSVLVAETGSGEPLGFVYLEVLRDYFVAEAHGHVGILAVAEAAEGRGAAGALMRAAEAWARGRGYRRLTLNVFDRNARARSVYAHLGFRPESLRYVKFLEEKA